MTTKTRKPKACGYCLGAPRTARSANAHYQCPGDGCACYEANHRPNTGNLRTLQARYCRLTEDECRKRDRGLDAVGNADHRERVAARTAATPPTAPAAGTTTRRGKTMTVKTTKRTPAKRTSAAPAALPKGYVTAADYSAHRTALGQKMNAPTVFAYMHKVERFPFQDRGEGIRPRFLVHQAKADAFLDKRLAARGRTLGKAGQAAEYENGQSARKPATRKPAVKKTTAKKAAAKKAPAKKATAKRAPRKENVAA